MVTVTPKSTLLGGPYGWRKLPISSLDEIDGRLSLKALAKESSEAQAAVVQRQVLRFEFRRLIYLIDLVSRDISVYANNKLRHRWVCRDDSGAHVPANDDAAWNPVDIVGDDQCVFILDRAYQSVYVHSFGRETISVAFQSDDPQSKWTRLSLDSTGCLLIHDAGQATALAYDRRGNFLGNRTANWPPIIKAEDFPPKPGPAPQTNDQLYEKSGFVLTKAIDSRLYNCSWHRMEIEIADLPPGTKIEVATFSYKEEGVAPVIGDDPRFVSAHTIIAPTQPPPAAGIDKKTTTEEFLIQSAPGQFLTIVVRLKGDGFATPVIRRLRVHFPRESYLEYLPPLFSADEPTRVFLERFLSIFQTEWDQFDRQIEESEKFFDPDSVPEGPAMDYLASILGVPLEGTWTGAQNRKLLQAVPKIYPHRGTVAALRDYIRVYLANFSGLTYEEISATPFPAIVEGYQERQFLMLSQAGGGALGPAGKPLWSPSVVKRLQLGVFAREGEVELVSTGDPERDLLHYFAHRFRVYVPAAWVRTAEDESLLRRAIETEMPAHVSYELCLIDAGVRVGEQTVVGLNMIIGDPPPLSLSCKPELDAPSLPGRNRLSSSVVLSGTGSPAVLNSDTRVGDWILN
jgi:phage tail-like protein